MQFCFINCGHHAVYYIPMVYFIFNWRIIALQYCIGLCHTTTWIAMSICMSAPSWVSPTPPSISPACVVAEYCVELPVLESKSPLAICFTYSSMCVSMLLSICPILFFPHPVQSLFSMSVSLLLLCKWVHQYHFSRVHMYTLIHDILSFWLTSLCITVRFIHLTKTGSNGWIVVHCMCVL